MREKRVAMAGGGVAEQGARRHPCGLQHGLYAAAAKRCWKHAVPACRASEPDRGGQGRCSVVSWAMERECPWTDLWWHRPGHFGHCSWPGRLEQADGGPRCGGCRVGWLGGNPPTLGDNPTSCPRPAETHRPRQPHKRDSWVQTSAKLSVVSRRALGILEVLNGTTGCRT